MQQDQGDKPQNTGAGHQPRQRDLSRYESSPARILKSLGIVVVLGTIFILFLKYVVGIKM